ncbi:hypothetical protein [Streptomyces sp. NPDC002758]
MTRSPPPRAPRAHIPGPRQVPPRRRRLRTGRRRRCRQAGVALWALAVLVTYATDEPTLPTSLLLFGGLLILTTFAPRTPGRNDRDTR